MTAKHTPEFDFYPFNHAGLVLADGNKAVLSVRGGHLCGYVALPADSVPAEWHGNYDADALQFLDIHGGLTFCDVSGGDEELRAINERLAKEKADADSNVMNREVMERWKFRREAALEAAKNTPYTHVVFGFDCAHAGDDERPELSNPDFVMDLTRRMEDQLLAFAAVITEWRAAGREQRIKMIETIRGDNPGQIGFGGLISMLGGADEFGAAVAEKQS